MFICGSCKEPTPPGIPVHRKAIMKEVKRVGGEGTRLDVAQEINLCPLCASHQEGMSVGEDECLEMRQFTYARIQAKADKLAERLRKPQAA